MNGRPVPARRRFLQQGTAWLALGAVAPGLNWLAGCRSTSALRGSRLHALGTEVTLLVRSHDARRAERAMHRALREVVAVHQDFTLFEPSPLQQLNRQARGGRVEVPAWLREVLTQAVQVHDRSDGLFDPAAGGCPADASAQVAAGSLRDVELDGERAALRLHGPRTALDFNGICKGAAVDRAAAVLHRHGLHHFIVNAGGDLLAAGDADDGQPGWPVHLQRAGGSVLTLRLQDRAAATSGNVERGLAQGQRHLRDPRLGTTVDPLHTATALHPSATQADAWATALFVAGPARAQSLCEREEALSAILVRHDGSTLTLGAA